MAYTDETLTNDAFERLKAINPATPESVIPRIVTLIPSALIQMAERVSRSSLSELLRTSFTTTAVNGVAPLNGLVNAAEPLLIDSRLEVFLVGTSNLAESVPDRATLLIESSVEFPFYSIEGLNILVRQANEDFGTYNDDVTIIGSRVPLSATTPLQLQGELVSTILGSISQGAT